MKNRINKNNVLIVGICDSVGGTDGEKQSVGHSGSLCVPMLFSQGHSDLSLLFWP